MPKGHGSKLTDQWKRSNYGHSKARANAVDKRGLLNCPEPGIPYNLKHET